MATKKNFIYFFPEKANLLDVRALENALRNTLPSTKYGQENGRYYILENNENTWRETMGKLKEGYEAYKTHRLLLSFSSDEKAKKAKQYLDLCILSYEVDIKSNDLIVYCLDNKQKRLIKDLKDFVNSHIKRHVII